MSHQPEARDKITNYTAKQAGDFLVNSIVFLVLLFGGMIACSAAAVSGAGMADHGSPPMCDGKIMQPDDVCDVYINGQLNHTDTYQDRVDQSQRDAASHVVVPIIAVVVLFVIALFMIKRIRELIAIRRRIAAQNMPESPLP